MQATTGMQMPAIAETPATAEAVPETAWSSFHGFSEFFLLLQYAIWFLFKYSLHFAYRYSFASKKKKIFSLQWISALFCLVF
jgi:hypothetical protein